MRENPQPTLLTGVPEATLGVIIFSLTTPAMRVAVQHFDPVVVGVGRVALAAIPALVLLLVLRSPLPTARQFRGILIATICIVPGFSWLLAAALREVPSFHASIVIGGIPLATALTAQFHGGKKQPPLFWVAAVVGGFLVAGYGFAKSGWQVSHADFLLVLAAIVCGIGYAEGARVGREIGSLALACWMPILGVPFALALCWNKLPADPMAIPFASWAAFIYCGVFSAFIGLIFWYRGLALGGTARIGQLQLAQPFFSLAAAAVLLHEALAFEDWLVAAGVVTCVAVAQTSSAPRRKPYTALTERSTTATCGNGSM